MKTKITAPTLNRELVVKDDDPFPQTSHLLKTDPLFSHHHEWQTHKLTPMQRAKLSFERCAAIGRAYALTPTDITTLSSSFWLSQRDPILVIDGEATTIFTLHYNLALGTLCSYLPFRCNEFEQLVDKMMRMEVNGQFLLTEVGHGLDAENLETRAVWVPKSDNMVFELENGHWELNTPRLEAGKYIMALTIPFGTGIPCVGVVFARMIVGDGDDSDKGVWPFLVDIHDGQKMCKGISARLLPPRGGSNPLPHAITYFDHVQLPAKALLAYPSQITSLLDPTTSEKNSNKFQLTPSKLLFAQALSRVTIGPLALSFWAVNALKLSVTIGWGYSWRRFIGPVSRQIPIISFSTQQNPILTAIAQVYVLDALCDWAVEWFSQSSTSSAPLDALTLRTRHAISSISKAISVQLSYNSIQILSTRCGAQGLFNINMMSKMQEEMRGISIAEGDILGVSIRLATELLLNRYELPCPPTNLESLLAKREKGLMDECRMRAAPGSHRSEVTNTYILPKCQKIVEAIGYRMAFDAAVVSVPKCVVDLFEASIVRLDEGWYVENIPGFTRKVIEEREVKALKGVMEIAGDLIDRWGLVQGGYVKAPIQSEEIWNEFVDGLEQFGGHGNDFVKAKL